MPYTPDHNPYIPGDPYSYDLKWLVEEINKAVRLYRPLNNEFDNLYNYVHDYLDNLDFPAEVQAVLDEWLDDGTFEDIIHQEYDPYINNIFSTLSQDIDELDGRVDQLVAYNTTNLSGWKVEDKFEIVTISGGLATYTWTNIPTGAVMLEAAYNEDINNYPWVTGDIQVFYEELNHQVTVSKGSLAGASCALKISYAYPEPVVISELTDIRVGADGITYNTAGDAVRNQLDAKLTIPSIPATDGVYTLKCTVSGGLPAYSWVADS